jgi:hypothetical protein
MSTVDGPPCFRRCRRACSTFLRHPNEQNFVVGHGGRNSSPHVAHGRGAVDGCRSGVSLISALPGSVTDERPLDALYG